MDPDLHRKVVVPRAPPCHAPKVRSPSEVTMHRRALLLLTLLLTLPSLFAEESFTERWEQRTTQTQSRQPAWPPPLVTTYVGLIQVFRADFTRQTASNLARTSSL